MWCVSSYVDVVNRRSIGMKGTRTGWINGSNAGLLYEEVEFVSSVRYFNSKHDTLFF